MKLLALLALVALVAGAFVLLTRGSSSEGAVVAHVVDGDTILLVGGPRVRLVQIDSPESGSECYGDEATAALRRLLPPGTRVRVEQDPVLDQIDRFGRTLAYVWKGDEDVSLRLVREGAAGAFFFDGRRGRHADELLEAAERARTSRRGLWGACPLARFDPLSGISSGPAS